MIGLSAKGRLQTDYSQMNKTLCLHISSAPESRMVLRKRTVGAACSRDSFELLSTGLLVLTHLFCTFQLQPLLFLEIRLNVGQSNTK